MLLGATVFGYIVGSLASIMQKFDVHAARYKDKIDEVKEYIKERGLSKELAKKLLRYYEYYMDTKSCFDEERILGELSTNLKRRVILHVNRNNLANIPFFDMTNQNFAASVLEIMTQATT